MVVSGRATPQQAVLPQVEFEREVGEHAVVQHRHPPGEFEREVGEHAVVQHRHPPGGIAGGAAWEQR